MTYIVLKAPLNVLTIIYRRLFTSGVVSNRGKMRNCVNAYGKMWNEKCGTTVISQHRRHVTAVYAV